MSAVQGDGSWTTREDDRLVGVRDGLRHALLVARSVLRECDLDGVPGDGCSRALAGVVVDNVTNLLAIFDASVAMERLRRDLAVERGP